MGALMRRYWTPVLLSSELERGGRCKRIRLLGESLVAFRSGRGQVGLLGEFCSHRRVSLYFGRVEDSGLRCVYHGWKYGVDGQCLDMPNEAPETDFKHAVRHPAYPCREAGGLVWAYMGPSKEVPELPDFEWIHLPENQCFISKYYQQCNYFQALEGGIDSSHISFLHAPVDPRDNRTIEQIDKSGFGVGTAVKTSDTSPRFEVLETDYGVMIAARRNAGEDSYYWRITQFLMPFYTLPPPEAHDPIFQGHAWVPSDDGNLINWTITWHAERPLREEEIAAMETGMGAHVMGFAEPTSEPYGDIRPAARRENDYGMDWQAHQSKMFCGIPGFGMQDRAMTESQGPIFDRTKERLGTSDTAIIQVRRCLIDAATALANRNSPPPGLDPRWHRIRSTSLILPRDKVWVDGAREPTRFG